MSIRDNYLEIDKRISEAAKRSGRMREDITLVAVTKTHAPSEMNEAIDAGATVIGENRVQELLEKYDDVKPVQWHLIGHLQTNKVKAVIDKVSMIQSVDSMHLAEEIGKRAGNAGIRMDILIEINSAMEESKSGISGDELYGLAREIAGRCDNIRIRGLMCIPPMAADPEEVRYYFREAKELFDGMKALGLPESSACIDTLSMGMSGDFEVAIEEGSTMVRVGSSIFGARKYR